MFKALVGGALAVLRRVVEATMKPAVATAAGLGALSLAGTAK